MKVNIPHPGFVTLDLGDFQPSALSLLFQAIVEARGSVETGSDADKKLCAAADKVDDTLRAIGVEGT